MLAWPGTRLGYRGTDPLNYRMVDIGSERGIRGIKGIWPSPAEGHSFVPLFVEVDDISLYVERAKDLGKNVVIPPQKLSGGDEMTVIIDPEGIPVALFRHSAV